jgi:hypothetical protein
MLQNLLNTIFDTFQGVAGDDGAFSQILLQVREWLKAFLPEQIAS